MEKQLSTQHKQHANLCNQDCTSANCSGVYLLFIDLSIESILTRLLFLMLIILYLSLMIPRWIHQPRWIIGMVIGMNLFLPVASALRTFVFEPLVFVMVVLDWHDVVLGNGIRCGSTSCTTNGTAKGETYKTTTCSCNSCKSMYTPWSMTLGFNTCTTSWARLYVFWCIHDFRSGDNWLVLIIHVSDQLAALGIGTEDIVLVEFSTTFATMIDLLFWLLFLYLVDRHQHTYFG